MARPSMLALAALALIGAAPHAEVSKLSWLSGAWVSDTSEEWTEELWTTPRGGMMLGTNKSGRGASATGYEFMRIAADGQGKVLFWGSPRGQPPVAFPLISSSPREVVFENPAHDYPTRIVYRREGDTLTGTISGPGGRNPVQWVFRRRSSP